MKLMGIHGHSEFPIEREREREREIEREATIKHMCF